MSKNSIKFKSLAGLIYIGLLAFSCNHDENPRGFATAMINGEEWGANTRIGINQPVHGGGLSVGFQVLDNNGLASESLSFTAYPRKVGKYEVNAWGYTEQGERANRDKSGWYVTIISGDALDESYEVSPRDDNILEITEINGNLIKGRFKVTFERDTLFGINNPSLPDIIRFTEGEFVGYIEE